MTQPQPGTLKHLIQKTVPISVTHNQVTLLITDGTTVRTITNNARNTANLSNLPHQKLLQLWQIGREVPARRWRTLQQQQSSTTITDNVDTILQKIQASATPDAQDLLDAARQALQGTDKRDEYQKINTMIQDMNNTQLRRLISFILLILLTQSAGD